MRTPYHTQKGLTLTEVLTASAITVLTLGLVLGTYAMLTQFAHTTTKQTIVQSKVRLAVEEMAQKIREASSISCPTTSCVRMTYEPDKIGQTGSQWTAEYVLSGTQLLYHPNTSSADEYVVINNVNLLTGQNLFEYNEPIVTIDLRVKNTFIDTTQYARIQTEVEIRNAD